MTFDLKGRTIHRLGYGTMQLPGKGVWGPPKDHDEALKVLRRAIELGVDFIDTADAYGPYTADFLLHEALHPYPADLVIATKAGFTRQGPNRWVPVGRPEYLKQQVELSLRFLGLETIELLQLHRIDPKVPVAESLGALTELQQEGKIRHIGLSEVSVGELQEAQKTAEIVTVQNRYNLANRSSEALLDHCERHGIGFIPWFPLETGRLLPTLEALAPELGATPSQLALAWLLKRSPVMLPIPGTSSVAHLEENLGARDVELSDDQFQRLSDAAA